MKGKKSRFRISLNSPVILLLVLGCFIATFFGMVTEGSSTELLFQATHSSLKNPMTYLHFFTHIFGHNTWGLFLENAIYLLLLGPMLEEKFGSLVLTVTVFCTAGITGILNYMIFPDTTLCGARCVFFAFIFLVSFTGFRAGEVPLTFILVVGMVVGKQIYEGAAITDKTAELSPLFGGLAGAVIGYMLSRYTRPGESLQPGQKSSEQMHEAESAAGSDGLPAEESTGGQESEKEE